LAAVTRVPVIVVHLPASGNPKLPTLPPSLPELVIIITSEGSKLESACEIRLITGLRALVLWMGGGADAIAQLSQYLNFLLNFCWYTAERGPQDLANAYRPLCEAVCAVDRPRIRLILEREWRVTALPTV
jgi:hypothetical protein